MNELNGEKEGDVLWNVVVTLGPGGPWGPTTPLFDPTDAAGA